jgi:NAD(P)H-hydrate epimerase
MRAISREESRALDRRATEVFGVPSLCLMENAGAGAARVALELLGPRPGPTVCLCGPGNNGGDGLVVARHLAVARRPVSVLLLPARGGGEPGGDAGVQLRCCRALGLRTEVLRPGRVAAQLGRAALFVDALFGTGLTEALSGLAAEVVDALAAGTVQVLALDVPSGLCCDTGRPLGPCVRATVTATFAAPKLGFEVPASREWTGEVRVVGIGAPVDWPAAPV